MTGAPAAAHRPLLDHPATAVAVVGASPTAFYARWVLANLLGHGFPGRILPVHPTHEEVLGIPAFPSVEALPVDPDLGMVALRAAACPGAVASLRRRGCATIVVLSDGFAETGTPEGAALQDDLVAAADGASLIGPNGMGVADVGARTVAIGGPLPPGLTCGGVSVVSHSGGLMATVLSGLVAEGAGVDLCLSLGNSAAFGLADALEACAARPTTEVVAAYVEGFAEETERLTAALGELNRSGTRLVMVRPGRSRQAQRLVESHTARVAGPHHVVEALFRRHGAVVVDDLETLVRAAVLAPLVPPGTGPVAVLSSSGGAASLTSDLADRHRMPLAQLDEETILHLAQLVPSSGTVGNPLDLSGAAVGTADAFSAVAADPGVGLLLLAFPAPFPDERPERGAHRHYLECLADTAARTGRPAVVSSLVGQDLPDWTSERREGSGLRVVQGMATTVAALAALLGPATTATAVAGEGDPSAATTRFLSELDGRRRLEAVGLAVVPGHHCADEQDVADAAHRVGFPLVAKGVLAGVAHKAVLGAVAVRLCDPGAAVAACVDIRRRCAAAGLDLDGFLLQEMVTGPELLVGATRHPACGAALTVGLGGAMAEAGLASATDLLPLADLAAARRLVQRAGLDPLLAAAGEAAALLPSYLLALGDAFLDPLADLTVLEINPLFLTHDGRVLAGDVLAEPDPEPSRRSA